jgi:hypothetical protein
MRVGEANELGDRHQSSWPGSMISDGFLEDTECSREFHAQ